MASQKIKAIIYTRQSVHREESISHVIQEQACRAYAASKGYEVVRVETDPGISGLNLDRRKALARSIEAVRNKEATVIIVWRWSRLSRARNHQALLLSDVEDAGGRVESALEPTEATAAGRFGRDVLLAMAAFESEQKAETWKQAHDNRLKNGLTPQGHARFGYRRVDKHGREYERNSPDSSARFELDPVTAPLVQEAYAMYNRGIGFKKIAEYWTEQGTTSLGGAIWAALAVRRTMDNEFYNGKIVYKGKEYDGAHERMVSPGVWNEYKRLRKTRSKVAPQTKASPWAFAGFVVCSRCGYSMVKNSSGGFTYLFCSLRRKSNGCEGVTAIMGDVTLSIWNWFGSHLKEWQKALPSESEAVIAADKAVSESLAEKDAAQARVDALISKAVRFDMSDAEIEKPLQEFRSELAAATLAHDQALALRSSYKAPADISDAILRGSENMSVPEWREAIGKVLAGVAIMPDRSILLVPRGENIKVWGRQTEDLIS